MGTRKTGAQKDSGGATIGLTVGAVAGVLLAPKPAKNPGRIL